MSVCAAGLSEGVELIVASDDGVDYADILPDVPMLRYTKVGPVGSGPGPTRNRALALARGAFVAYLDADDTWAPGYLTALLPLARQSGLAFGRTQVFEAGQMFCVLPDPKADTLSLEDVGRTGASYHPLVARSQARKMLNRTSQDVRHTVELLACHGGQVPLGDTAYELRLRPGSLTTPEDYSVRVARAYAEHAAELAQSDLPVATRQRAVEVFRQKAKLNAAYEKERISGESFYRFVARKMAAQM